jgi:hypothetical protein
MLLTRYIDIAAFAVRAQPFLLEREAYNCRAIGNLTAMLRGDTAATNEPYLALVEDNSGHVIEVVMAMSPHDLMLSHLAPGAEPQMEEVIRLVADDAVQARLSLPGTQGPVESARVFTERWEQRTGQRVRLDANERIYQLSRVRPVRPVPGAMRRIEEDDRPLLRAWLRAFWIEAMGLPDHPHVDDDITNELRFVASGMYLWQDGAQSVSLAGYGGPTPHGARIGPVYTPPETRGQGYASALVAALSQLLLDEGRQYVFLFTDLANPTSNHIYQEIGYEPVGDITEYRFQPTRSASARHLLIVAHEDRVNI